MQQYTDMGGSALHQEALLQKPILLQPVQRLGNGVKLGLKCPDGVGGMFLKSATYFLHRHRPLPQAKVLVFGAVVVMHVNIPNPRAQSIDPLKHRHVGGKVHMPDVQTDIDLVALNRRYSVGDEIRVGVQMILDMDLDTRGFAFQKLLEELGPALQPASCSASGKWAGGLARALG